MLDRREQWERKETNLLPCLEGVAPRVALRVRADPATGATVEVEVVRGRLNYWEACLGDVDGVGRGNPHKDERLRGERDVEGKNHL